MWTSSLVKTPPSPHSNDTGLPSPLLQMSFLDDPYTHQPHRKHPRYSNLFKNSCSVLILLTIAVQTRLFKYNTSGLFIISPRTAKQTKTLQTQYPPLLQMSFLDDPYIQWPHHRPMRSSKYSTGSDCTLILVQIQNVHCYQTKSRGVRKTMRTRTCRHATKRFENKE